MKFMYKFSSILTIIILLVSLSLTCVMGDTIDSKAYKYKHVEVDGTFCKNLSKHSYKKIIKSYGQLKSVKKYVKKNYNNPKKYLRILNKYNKKYFKKNALIFVLACEVLAIFNHSLLGPVDVLLVLIFIISLLFNS